MPAIPVIPVTPTEPPWLQAAIAAINAELAAGTISVSELFAQIASLEARLISSVE